MICLLQCLVECVLLAAVYFDMHRGNMTDRLMDRGMDIDGWMCNEINIVKY